MKNQNYDIIGEATRIEYENSSNRLFIVFEIKNEKHKKFIRENWAKDIFFRIIDKFLIKDE